MHRSTSRNSSLDDNAGRWPMPLRRYPSIAGSDAPDSEAHSAGNGKKSILVKLQGGVAVKWTELAARRPGAKGSY